MIDSHCHLEWKSYDEDRDAVIDRCKKELKAVVSSCSRPWDFDKALAMQEKHKGFVFVTAGFHPEFMKEVDEKTRSDYIRKIIANRARIVGIGEVGLDYAWLKEPDEQERSRKLFAEMIGIAKRLDMPIVVHSREAHPDTLRILEENGAKRVLLHMWGGHQKELIDKVKDLGYFVSVNTIVLRSKGYSKVVKAMPIEKMMLETDSPWLGVRKEGEEWVMDQSVRNEPTSIKMVAKKIAEIKKMPFERVWRDCGENSARFFGLIGLKLQG